MMTRGGRGVKNAENLMTSYVNDPYEIENLYSLKDNYMSKSPYNFDKRKKIKPALNF